MKTNQKKTTEQVISEFRAVHGDKYDYSKVDYVNNHTKVCIICPKHGEFYTTPKNFLRGHGCPKCSHRSWKYTVDEVKEKIEKLYDKRYDTSLIKAYNSNRDKLPLICKKHGLFYATLMDLNHNHACQACGHERNFISIRKTKEQFIEDAKKVHGDKYDYSKVEYVNSSTKVCIICPKHGEFWQKPSEHLSGKGCNICNSSHLEKVVRNLLIDANIKYIEHCNKSVLKWLNRQHLDFYLPDYNAAIECQGIQHFEPIEFFGGKTAYKRLKTLDNNKKKLCENQKINLFYYSNVNLNELNGNKVFHDTEELIKNIKALIK